MVTSTNGLSCQSVSTNYQTSAACETNGYSQLSSMSDSLMGSSTGSCQAGHQVPLQTVANFNSYLSTQDCQPYTAWAAPQNCSSQCAHTGYEGQQSCGNLSSYQNHFCQSYSSGCEQSQVYTTYQCPTSGASFPGCSSPPSWSPPSCQLSQQMYGCGSQSQWSCQTPQFSCPAPTLSLPNPYSTTSQMNYGQPSTCGITNPYSTSTQFNNSSPQLGSISNPYSTTTQFNNSSPELCSISNPYSTTTQFNNSSPELCSVKNPYSTDTQFNYGQPDTCEVQNPYSTDTQFNYGSADLCEIQNPYSTDTQFNNGPVQLRLDNPYSTTAQFNNGPVQLRLDNPYSLVPQFNYPSPQIPNPALTWPMPQPQPCNEMGMNPAPVPSQPITATAPPAAPAPPAGPSNSTTLQPWVPQSYPAVPVIGNDPSQWGPAAQAVGSRLVGSADLQQGITLNGTNNPNIGDENTGTRVPVWKTLQSDDRLRYNVDSKEFFMTTAGGQNVNVCSLQDMQQQGMVLPNDFNAYKNVVTTMANQCQTNLANQATGIGMAMPTNSPFQAPAKNMPLNGMSPTPATPANNAPMTGLSAMLAAASDPRSGIFE